MPKNQTALIEPDLLARYGANWHYLLVSNEERDQFHTEVIGPLLGMELTHGMAATAKLNEAIETARAQTCRTWIDEARRKLREMITAEETLKRDDETALLREESAAAKKVESAKATVEKAMRDLGSAKESHTEAAARLKAYRTAETVLGTGDLILLAAFAASKGEPRAVPVG